MWPLKMVMSLNPLFNTMPLPVSLASVEEMVKPFKSSVTPLALMLMALPLCTMRLVVR